MSDWNWEEPPPRRDPRDPHDPPEWPEDPRSSVFGPPSAPPPDPWLPEPDPTVVQPHYPGYSDTAYPDPTRQQPRPYPGQGPGQRARRPPGRSTPPHGRPRAGGGGRRPPGDPSGRRSRSERERDRSRKSGSGFSFPLGLGALLGVAGVTCFVLSVTVLPWFTADGEDVTLEDIRTAFDVPKTDPDDILGDSSSTTVATTIPGSVPDSLPSPDDVQDTVTDAVEQEVRDAAANAAASVIDTGKARYLELYAGTLWMVLIGALGVSVLLATFLSPKSTALSLLMGFRSLAVLATVAAAAVHGAALWVVFTGTGSPSPATGIWVGGAGLALVFLACILGPKRR